MELILMILVYVYGPLFILVGFGLWIALIVETYDRLTGKNDNEKEDQ